MDHSTMESDTVQAPEQDNNKDDEKAIKTPVNSPQTIKRTHIVAGEFEHEERENGGNYDKYSIKVNGEFAGYLYVKQDTGLFPTKLNFKEIPNVQTDY